jgi:transcriptional regulator with XRE-family HTH domain
MGAPRPKPERLAEKLLAIRTALGVSQPVLHKRLGVEHLIEYHIISRYEQGKREPPLMILLEYARLANVYVDVLIDDGLDLPARLPSPTKSEGIRRKPASRPKRSKR